MSELPEGELAGVGVDAPPQGHFPPGDVRRHPEAPGHSYPGQAAAEPTSGQHQVPSEDPLSNEIEIDDGEAPQLPVESGSQAAPTVTTGGVVEVPLQHPEFLGNIWEKARITAKKATPNPQNNVFVNLPKSDKVDKVGILTSESEKSR
jgi:hypothetical protein